MRKHFIGCLFVAAAALAQQPVAYVSTDGNDENFCTSGAPCRELKRALQQVFFKGHIIILTGGDFESFTIDKAVSIKAVSERPVIRSTIAPAIIVNTNGVSDVVTISGLSLIAVGGTNGVLNQRSGSLHLVDLQIEGFPGAAVISSENSQKVFLSESRIRGSEPSVRGGNGVVIPESIDPAMLTHIHRVTFENLNTAVLLPPGPRVSLTDSNIVAAQTGLSVTGSVAKLRTEAVVERTSFTGGGTALVANDNAIIRVSNCVIINNREALQVSAGGQIFSRGNNTVEGNQNNSLFTGQFASR